MDRVKFPLWIEKGSRPSLQYGFLLKLIVLHKLYLRRHGYYVTWNLIHPFEFLIDLCWNDLPLLDEVITKLTIPRPQHQQYPSSWHPDSKDVDVIRKFLCPSGWTQEDALATDITYLSKLDWYRRNIMGIQDEELKNYTRTLKGSYKRIDLRLAQPFYDTRFRHLDSYRSSLQDRLNLCLEETGQLIEHFLNDNPYLQHENHSSDAINEVDLAKEIYGMKNNPESLVLFAVSGSGKTRSIKRLLSRHFGFYFQGCSVTFQPQGLHSARRIPGSKDTLSLAKMIRFARSIHQGVREVDETIWVGEWLQCLIKYRIVVFAQFLKVAGKREILMKYLPQLWFELQVSNREDLFDEGFQLAYLIGMPLDFTKYRHKIEKQLDPAKMYFCLDEAQANIDADIRTPDGTVSLLNLWARELSVFNYTTWRTYNPVIYSGTSLSTEEAVKAVKYGGFTEQFDEDGSLDDPACEIFSNFPAIRGEKQLKEVIRKHGMTMIEQSGKEAIEMIVEHARPLYGRPVWSIRYLEHVKEVLSAGSSSSLSPSALREKIANAADGAMKEVKGDLQNRLYQLQDQGLEKLMEDLCRVVVWSDLLDRPTPFWDETGPTLIQEAFAVFKPRDGKSQYFLEEKLALDAAKEFFLIKRPGLVKRSLGEFLQEQVNAVSSLGKAAEYFLAWNLDRIFVNDDDRLLGSKEKGRLPQLLEALKKARRFNTTEALDPSEYILLRGDIMGHTYDRSVELPCWMELVRTSRRPNATFFFPENNTGPDLMFALQNPSMKEDIVLCLLQLKCGDADLKKGIMSTNLSKAYHSEKGDLLKGFSDKYDTLQRELRKWSASKLRILRVLVTASVHAAKGDRGDPGVAKGSSCPEYFIRFDAEQTKLLFGDEFQVLLDAVRSGNKSLSEIYRDLNVDGKGSKHRRGSNDESTQPKKRRHVQASLPLR